jgi:Fe-S cluster assembly ATP-binding protein
MADLEIRNLHVRAADKDILKGLDLTASKGEIHALMGPNGSGKSTLANVIMGQPNLEVTEGQIIFKGQDIRKLVEQAMELTHVPREFSSRYLNEGFSGGEKKRLEILQLALQRPEIAILDETDSGLDIDALNTVAHGVNTVASESDLGVLIITHYQRILHLVKPDRVSIMYEGRIVRQGGSELVEQLEREGYGWVRDEAAAAA